MAAHTAATDDDVLFVPTICVDMLLVFANFELALLGCVSFACLHSSDTAAVVAAAICLASCTGVTSATVDCADAADEDNEFFLATSCGGIMGTS